MIEDSIHKVKITLDSFPSSVSMNRGYVGLREKEHDDLPRRIPMDKGTCSHPRYTQPWRYSASLESDRLELHFRRNCAFLSDNTDGLH